LLGSGTLSGESVESKEASETDQQLNEVLLRKLLSNGELAAEKQIISEFQTVVHHPN
jgi:hypothetical protein